MKEKGEIEREIRKMEQNLIEVLSELDEKDEFFKSPLNPLNLPFIGKLLKSIHDWQNESISTLLGCLKTAVYICASNELIGEIREEFLWKIGESRELFTRFYQFDVETGEFVLSIDPSIKPAFIGYETGEPEKLSARWFDTFYHNRDSHDSGLDIGRACFYGNYRLANYLIWKNKPIIMENCVGNLEGIMFLSTRQKKIDLKTMNKCVELGDVKTLRYIHDNFPKLWWRFSFGVKDIHEDSLEFLFSKNVQISFVEVELLIDLDKLECIKIVARKKISLLLRYDILAYAAEKKRKNIFRYILSLYDEPITYHPLDCYKTEGLPGIIIDHYYRRNFLLSKQLLKILLKHMSLDEVKFVISNELYEKRDFFDPDCSQEVFEYLLETANAKKEDVGNYVIRFLIQKAIYSYNSAEYKEKLLFLRKKGVEWVDYQIFTEDAKNWPVEHTICQWDLEKLRGRVDFQLKSQKERITKIIENTMEKLTKGAKIKIFQPFPFGPDALLSGSFLLNVLLKDGWEPVDWEPNNLDIFCLRSAIPRMRDFLMKNRFFPMGLDMKNGIITERWVLKKCPSFDSKESQYICEKYDLPLIKVSLRGKSEDEKDQEDPIVQLILFSDKKREEKGVPSLIREHSDLSILENWWDGDSVVISHPQDIKNKRSTFRNITRERFEKYEKRVTLSPFFP